MVALRAWRPRVDVKLPYRCFATRVDGATEACTTATCNPTAVDLCSGLGGYGDFRLVMAGQNLIAAIAVAACRELPVYGVIRQVRSATSWWDGNHAGGCSASLCARIWTNRRGGKPAQHGSEK